MNFLMILFRGELQITEKCVIFQYNNLKCNIRKIFLVISSFREYEITSEISYRHTLVTNHSKYLKRQQLKTNGAYSG